MKYVKFGKHDFEVSRFGLGCMRFPKIKLEDGTEVINEKEAIDIIRTAIDGGVNYIDTAYVYPGSEVVVGKALQDGYREKVKLVTKLPIWSCTSEEDLQKFMDEELERLQTDYLDIYLLHNLFEANWAKVKQFNAIEFMKKQKEAGKAKLIGFSCHGQLSHWKEVVDANDWDVCMMQYNYFDKYYQAGEEGLKYASAKGLPVIIMESLRGGMLGQTPPENVAEKLAKVPGETYGEKSFAWLINQPECTVMLSGCSSVEHVKENLKTFDKYEPNHLTEEQLKAYDEAREEWNKKTLVACTGCAYCMPCPMGVDIPGIFKYYNDTVRVLDKSQSQTFLYAQLFSHSKKDPTQCIECGKCMSHCPQNIQIPVKLKEAHEACAPKN
ncbi:MAG: aldo/keto reductase [Clostridia bacterium]|nr:aldo/keto reductase [Clostridia bacterium]